MEQSNLAAPRSAAPSSTLMRRISRPSQEGVVAILGLLLFLIFTVALNGFLTAGNLITLLKNVTILGTLALGMGLVVIGRGIDLAQIATMVVGVSVALGLAGHEVGLGVALGVGALFVVVVGIIVGIFIAYADVPAIFATLAAGSIVYGLGRTWQPSDVVYAPGNSAFISFLGSGKVVGIPVPVVVFLALALILDLVLKHSRLGRFIYASGDSHATARTIGIPVRIITVAQYVISGLIAYMAGLLMVGMTSGINTRLYDSTMLYDVLLVVVLGGIGLSGGRGSVRNILVGTTFVGLLLNGMTLMNFSYTTQNLCKSMVLLSALVIDSLLNPREEQTAQHGDI